jgi:hypothetical protein
MARYDRGDSGPFPAMVLVFLCVTLVVTAYLMSQAPQPTVSGIDTYAAVGSETCTSYLGTPYDC